MGSKNKRKDKSTVYFDKRPMFYQPKRAPFSVPYEPGLPDLAEAIRTGENPQFSLPEGTHRGHRPEEQTLSIDPNPNSSPTTSHAPLPKKRNRGPEYQHEAGGLEMEFDPQKPRARRAMYAREGRISGGRDGFEEEQEQMNELEDAHNRERVLERSGHRAYPAARISKPRFIPQDIGMQDMGHRNFHEGRYYSPASAGNESLEMQPEYRPAQSGFRFRPQQQLRHENFETLPLGPSSREGMSMQEGLRSPSPVTRGRKRFRSSEQMYEDDDVPLEPEMHRSRPQASPRRRTTNNAAPEAWPGRMFRDAAHYFAADNKLSINYIRAHEVYDVLSASLGEPLENFSLVRTKQLQDLNKHNEILNRFLNEYGIRDVSARRISFKEPLEIQVVRSERQSFAEIWGKIGKLVEESADQLGIKVGPRYPMASGGDGLATGGGSPTDGSGPLGQGGNAVAAEAESAPAQPANESRAERHGVDKAVDEAVEHHDDDFTAPKQHPVSSAAIPHQSPLSEPYSKAPDTAQHPPTDQN